MTVKEEHWPLLLKFAHKNGKIDFKFMLEIYRGRHAKMDAPPLYFIKKILNLNLFKYFE